MFALARVPNNAPPDRTAHERQADEAPEMSQQL